MVRFTVANYNELAFEGHCRAKSGTQVNYRCAPIDLRTSQQVVSMNDNCRLKEQWTSDRLGSCPATKAVFVCNAGQLANIDGQSTINHKLAHHTTAQSVLRAWTEHGNGGR